MGTMDLVWTEVENQESFQVDTTALETKKYTDTVQVHMTSTVQYILYTISF